MNNNFIILLKNLSEQEEPFDHVIINEEVSKLVDLDFTDSKIYLTKFVSHILSVIETELLEEVFNYLDIIYKKLYKNISTRDSQMSKQIRSIISKRYGINSKEHQLSKTTVRLSCSEKSLVINKQQNSLDTAHKEINRFSQQKMVKLIEDNIRSECPYEISVALALCSGCRCVELFDETVTFKIIDKNWISQNKSAKKKGLIKEIIKPIIVVSTDYFTKKLNEMRNLIYKDNEEVLKNGCLIPKISSKCNRTFKKLVDEKGYTFHSCRKIYTDIAYSLFAKNSTYGKDPDIAMFRSKILGHENISTQVHYSNFKMSDENISKTDFERLENKIDKLLEHFLINSFD